jgi:RND family efflux transporter MFP subunit
VLKVALVVLALLTLLAIAGRAAVSLTASRSGVATHDIATPRKGDVKLAVREVGSIEPLRKTEIKAKVSGQVAKIAVDVGDRVKAGDVLIDLDPVDVKRDVAVGTAQLGVTYAELRSAERLLATKQRMVAAGVTPRGDLLPLEAEVARLSAVARVGAADLAQRRDRLGYMRIRSPIDGVVLVRNVQPGELVTQGTASIFDGRPLLVVAQVEKLVVRTELNQVDVGRTHVDEPVAIKVDAVPGHTFKGTVYRIAAMAEASQRKRDANLVFPVEVLLDTSQDGAAALRPGMIADVDIDVEAHAGVTTLPIEALVHDGDRLRVWRVGGPGEKDQLVDVGVGLQNDEVFEVLSGVSEGDQVRIKPSEAPTVAAGG